VADLLQDEILSAIDWLRQLSTDLYAGRAKEVPAELGHVYQHFWNETPAPSTFAKDGTEISMIKREQCVDFLKLHGIYFYIATCPRTGIRFVEWAGKDRLEKASTLVGKKY
jgi:hypothetical protein